MIHSNKISLIGMPSAGKTTVGLRLAEMIGFDFKDLDTMVEDVEGKSLIEVMNQKGADYFRNMEYDFLTQLKPEDRVVISPAGSIIFQAAAVKWLEENTHVIFLDTPFEVLEERLAETPKAVAGLKERGLKSIWDERRPLYLKHSRLVVDTRGKGVQEVVEEISKECIK